MRRTSLLPAIAVFAVLVAGCDSGNAGTEESPDTPVTSGSQSEPTTAPAGPAPATGTVVAEPNYSFRLPKGWTQDKEVTPGVAALAPDRDGFTYLLVSTRDEKNFDDVRRLSPDVLKTFRSTVKQGKALPVTEWAGEPAYHLAGNGSIAGFAEQFGVVWGDQHVLIKFDFHDRGGRTPWSAEKRRKVIESVEASWEWK